MQASAFLKASQASRAVNPWGRMTRANRMAPPTFAGLEYYGRVMTDPVVWDRLHTTDGTATVVGVRSFTGAQDMYDLLFHAHHQHRAITEALENGEGARVESLLKEHVYSQKKSMNLIGHRAGMQQSALSGHPVRAKVSERPATA